MLMFRVLRHLLPSGLAWRATIDKALRRYLDGLSTSYADARVYVDDVYDDLFPSRTRWLSRWERQFGLSGRGSTADRIANLEAAWQAQGGQSPRYVHDLLRTAGFDVCLHEWWTTDVSPRSPFDPRLVAVQPVVGTNHCDAVNGTQPQCLAESVATLLDPQPQCDAFLGNHTKYLVNKTLRRVAPPPLPSDPLLWPFFWYLSGSPYSREVPAILDGAGRDTLERLALKVGPTHQWIVTNIDWAEPPAFITEDGAHRWTSRDGVVEGSPSTWTSSKGDVVESLDSTVLHERLFERITGVLVDSPNAWVGQVDVDDDLFDAFEGANAWSIAACLRTGYSGTRVIRLNGTGLEDVTLYLASSGFVRIETHNAAGDASLLQDTVPDHGDNDVVSLIATYDGAGTFTIYANGSLLATTTTTHRTITSLDELVFDSELGVADVCLLNREIDATEAAAYGAYADALYRPKSDVAGGVIERWRAAVLSDGTVSSWPGDKGAFTLGPPAVGTEPESEATLIENKFRGVEFDGDDALDVACTGALKTAMEGSFSFAWLGKLIDANGGLAFWANDTAAAGVPLGSVFLFVEDDQAQLGRISTDGATGTTAEIDLELDVSRIHAFVATYDDSAGTFAFFVDGKKVGEATDVALTGMTFDLDVFRIFGDGGGFGGAPYGTVAEATVFDSKLSDDDAEDVGNWLMWLYSSCDLPGEEGGMGDFEFLLIG